MTFDQGTPEELLRPFDESEQKQAPKEMLVAGDRYLLRSGPAASLVGSRAATPAGLARADKLARLLVKRGVIFMSGLAEGIDTTAHLGAIEERWRTIAVLGTPLDQYFPAKSPGPQNDIMRDHFAVTQFQSGTKVDKHTFSMRNRTKSLLPIATGAIEAKAGSGSLHQGWEEIRLGRRSSWPSRCSRCALEFPREFERYGPTSISFSYV